MSVDSKLQIVLCPGRFPEAAHRELYNKAYRCWFEVWAQTFLEIDNNPNTFSDAFTRQDLISCLFYDGECIALSFYRHVDFENPSTQKDSYFANWSDLHLKHLCKNGDHVVVGSYVTIHPSARKSALGLKMRDYLIGLASLTFLHMDCDAMTGAMRKNRKIHEAVYEWGAIPIGTDVESGHGDLVDLVGFFKHEVSVGFQKHGAAEELLKLWNSKLVIAQELPELGIQYKTQFENPLKKVS